MNTEILVKKSKKGDISAFMELLREKQELFYKIAFTYTKNSYDAEDCISEAAIKGYEKIKQLKKWNKFYSWFTSILVNICRKQYREKLNFSSKEILEDIKDSFSYNSVEDQIIIEELLEKLKKDEREILMLRYLKDYPIKDVAFIMDIPVNTVKTKIYRSLKFLKSKTEEVKNEYR
ncbi:RNA polymerase sigma factor [Clostridium cochlearium]|uniref:Sigma-70 family RNA polymerase sigma factor n=1 Tax=Clostridium cochlearium TaxID=1494 RepID=A0A7Y3V7E6_CLOCO|nr:sigma-70 family RNA polymerase sigma factor [Clostridium cochlearium]NOH16108.1 sigma-70 family RNA polymerase sigma factor [Clostridium cochlearium]